jgi:hypothetical protein
MRPLTRSNRILFRDAFRRTITRGGVTSEARHDNAEIGDRIQAPAKKIYEKGGAAFGTAVVARISLDQAADGAA